MPNITQEQTQELYLSTELAHNRELILSILDRLKEIALLIQKKEAKRCR